MANKILRCTTECRLTNDQGLEEHYEDEVGQDLYEVTEERAAQLIASGNFVPAPPGSPFHTSFVGATSPPAPAPTPSVSQPSASFGGPASAALGVDLGTDPDDGGSSEAGE